MISVGASRKEKCKGLHRSIEGGETLGPAFWRVRGAGRGCFWELGCSLVCLSIAAIKRGGESRLRGVRRGGQSFATTNAL